MGKYIEIGKIFIKAQLVWRGDVLLHMVFSITKILFAYLLWGVIFQSNSKVAGFSFYTMLSYYIISAFLNHLDLSSEVSKEISSKIKNGTFSKYMILPVQIEKYFIAKTVGVTLIYLFFGLIASALWIFIFQIEFTFIKDMSTILVAFFMILLGLLFMLQLNYFLGILTLKYQEIGIFLMIKNHIVAFVTGSIIPLVLLPQSFLSIMKLFPFYYVNYLPSMLLIGRAKKEMITGILVLGAWCLVIQLLIGLSWGKYRRKYDGVGI